VFRLNCIISRLHTEYKPLTMFMTAVKVTDLGLKLHHPKGEGGEPNFFIFFFLLGQNEVEYRKLPASALTVSVGGWAWILPIIKSL
jgi:hypothetical protein